MVLGSSASSSAMSPTVRPSSRQNPYIRFEQLKKLYRSAFNLDKLSFRYLQKF